MGKPRDWTIILITIFMSIVVIALLIPIGVTIFGFVSGTGNPRGPFVPSPWHDDERNVTCWTYNGIYCMPDSWLQEPSTP